MITAEVYKHQSAIQTKAQSWQNWSQKFQVAQAGPQFHVDEGVLDSAGITSAHHHF